MIGSLLYLTYSRLDIMQEVGIVARFQTCPREIHVVAIKRIFKYLQGIEEYGLWCDRSEDFNLKAYTDANWVGSIDDRKSTSGVVFFLGDFLVSWFSKKQGSIYLSTTDVEYIVVANWCP